MSETPAAPPERPEFEVGATVYRFEALTLGQMERLAGLMHEARKNIFDSLTGQEHTAQSLTKLTIRVADVVHELQRSGKLSEFIAVCMRPKGQGFDPDAVAGQADAFKQLEYEQAEDVLRFFFTTGSFAKLLIPSFLRPAEAENPPETGS